MHGQLLRITSADMHCSLILQNNNSDNRQKKTQGNVDYLQLFTLYV